MLELLMLTAIVSTSGRQVAPKENFETCLSPFIGGVLAGQSVDKELVKLLGKGLEVNDDVGHARIYANKDATKFLVARMETDDIVFEMEIASSIEYIFPERIAQNKAVDIPKIVDFPPETNVYLLQDVHFGSSVEFVIGILGKPSNTETNQGKNGETLLEYRSKCSCELPAGLSFKFMNGKLVSINYWAASG
jgi:hypothetical protein